jgi:hypothetical protein
VIVFGKGPGKLHDHGPTLPVTCSRCHNAVMYHYVNRTRWLRLYFIPILPVAKVHLLLCPICNHGPEIGREDLPRLQALHTVAVQYQRHSVSEEDFRRAVDAYTGGGTPTLPSPMLDVPARPAAAGHDASAASSGPVPLEPVPPAIGPPAAWYPDPDGSTQLRWWDGKGWTGHYKPPEPEASP